MPGPGSETYVSRQSGDFRAEEHDGTERRRNLAEAERQTGGQTGEQDDETDRHGSSHGGLDTTGGEDR